MFRKQAMSRTQMMCLLAVAAAAVSIPAFVGGQSFVRHGAVKVTNMNGWHVLGDANWKAENGELIGTPKAGSKGGWLVLDRSLQDTGLYASFRCTGGCSTGVLLRAEKTAQGMKGIYVSLDEAPRVFAVTLDAAGKELQREPLRRPGGGQIRIAPPPPAPPANAPPGPAAGKGGAPPQAQAPTGPALPITAPDSRLRPGDWNRIEILLDANIVRAFLNDGGENSGVAEDEAGRTGPLALYIGGTGEVRFKDVFYKDLGDRMEEPEKVSSNYRLQRVNDLFYSWGQAAGDFNRDGVTDIVAGPYIFYGPDFTKSREIYLAHTWNASREYPNDAWVQLAADFTGDGWPDVLTTSHSGRTGAILYVNPKGEPRRWDRHQVVPIVQTEITVLHDMDGDGKVELVYAAEGFVRYAKPDPADPTKPWIITNVSENARWPAHGIGAGDVNGDGLPDIVNAYGWWEHPKAGSTPSPWTWHPEAFGRWNRASPGGSVMAIYDANGDGLNDIVTSLQAHGFGLAWFEQKRDAAGKISFAKHMIMDDFTTKNAGDVTFSQLHGSTFGDVDGDGITDFIVGKRYWSHLDDYIDVDPYGPPVLYAYRTVRNRNAPGGAEFVPELIHNRSGVGSDALAVDLNNDSALDIVTSTSRGTLIFWGQRKAQR